MHRRAKALLLGRPMNVGGAKWKKRASVSALVVGYALFGWEPQPIADAAKTIPVVPALPPKLPVTPCHRRMTAEYRRVCVESHLAAALQEYVENYRAKP
jgi:hypothetical protein